MVQKVRLGIPDPLYLGEGSKIASWRIRDRLLPVLSSLIGSPLPRRVICELDNPRLRTPILDNKCPCLGGSPLKHMTKSMASRGDWKSALAHASSSACPDIPPQRTAWTCVRFWLVPGRSILYCAGLIQHRTHDGILLRPWPSS